VSLTQRHDMAVVMPLAGNTFERTPGNRARRADLRPMDTVHGTFTQAMVLPARGGAYNHLRDTGTEPSPSLTTVGHHALVTAVRRNAGLLPADEAPTATVSAGGRHLGVVVAHFDPGWARRAEREPFGSITTRDHHSLVIPYDSTGNSRQAGTEPSPTLTTHDRVALVVPETTDGTPLPSRDVTDSDIDDCGFRMFELHEIAMTMAMDRHPHEGVYVVVGNKRERMAQYGNAVTPPVMQLLVDRIVASLA
jgi:DNA (cytosine-5)-methyltransferase 1